MGEDRMLDRESRDARGDRTCNGECAENAIKPPAFRQERDHKQSLQSPPTLLASRQACTGVRAPNLRLQAHLNLTRS